MKSQAHRDTAIALLSISPIPSKTFVSSMPANLAMFLRSFFSLFFKVTGDLPILLLESLVMIIIRSFFYFAWMRGNMIASHSKPRCFDGCRAKTYLF